MTAAHVSVFRVTIESLPARKNRRPRRMGRAMTRITRPDVVCEGAIAADQPPLP